MKRLFVFAAALAATSAAAQPDASGAPSPGEIVAAARADEWADIAPDDLLVMDLAPDRDAKPRRVIIQLIASPFSQPWVANIRTLAEAHWWDGLAIVRAQDNYVVQWGDPDAEDTAKAKPLPERLIPTAEDAYLVRVPDEAQDAAGPDAAVRFAISTPNENDLYAPVTGFHGGWPLGLSERKAWPVHCYGSVGVGRNLSPDAGSGAELYAVIGHAPRHLDRNIAVVGRVIEGIEHLATLPRGTEALGFYRTPEERTSIASVRLGRAVPGLPTYQYLSTESESFARYADARANRRDPFFIVPAGGADVCNIPVPVRRKAAG
ncbi:peptidylprolyl isomerase [Tsuneonella sp. YG55]|uniref:peptidylprolyl isomerase n=1 Tax=Tsuneonella litorea TaxID=2976475 RepID=A0A9X2W223_9SPHN|nr:peptidylprolyl isomerase [Tsuneonella litorea]MCT2558461.1 peptidylprolyl isomerase [Tsuneonella litorea]